MQACWWLCARQRAWREGIRATGELTQARFTNVHNTVDIVQNFKPPSRHTESQHAGAVLPRRAQPPAGAAEMPSLPWMSVDGGEPRRPMPTPLDEAGAGRVSWHPLVPAVQVSTQACTSCRSLLPAGKAARRAAACRDRGNHTEKQLCNSASRHNASSWIPYLEALTVCLAQAARLQVRLPSYSGCPATAVGAQPRSSPHTLPLAAAAAQACPQGASLR